MRILSPLGVIFAFHLKGLRGGAECARTARAILKIAAVSKKSYRKSANSV